MRFWIEGSCLTELYVEYDVIEFPERANKEFLVICAIAFGFLNLEVETWIGSFLC